MWYDSTRGGAHARRRARARWQRANRGSGSDSDTQRARQWQLDVEYLRSVSRPGAVASAVLGNAVGEVPRDGTSTSLSRAQYAWSHVTRQGGQSCTEDHNEEERHWQEVEQALAGPVQLDVVRVAWMWWLAGPSGFFVFKDRGRFFRGRLGLESADHPRKHQMLMLPLWAMRQP